MLERVKNFSTLIGISALLVAGSAAFFSVFGLSRLFSGAFFSVIIMAGSLEFAKLVAASFLYRYWNDINRILKAYLMIGVGTLVLITSAGIFGYLSNAYQGATVGFEKQSTLLISLEERLEQLEEDKVFLKEELEAQVNDLPENYRTARRKLREDYNPQIQQVNQDILNIKTEISDLEIQLVETGVDVGPAIYLAKSFNTDVDSVVKFFIFILIFVFDPLALSMVLAWNISLREKEFEVYGEVDKIFENYKKKKEPKIEEPKVEEPKVEEPIVERKVGRDARK